MVKIFHAFNLHHVAPQTKTYTFYATYIKIYLASYNA